MTQAFALLLAGSTCIMISPLAHSNALMPLDIRHVKVGGEIGRRIDVTVENNIMVLDADADFLAPFQKRTRRGGYVGLGKLIDALVRFAAYTGDQRVLERKQHVVRETIATQEPDGYLGMFVPKQRVWALWDIHEMAYLIYALTTDYHYFGEGASLGAARKAADYIIERWSADPAKEPGGGDITVYMAVTGLEPALLALHEASGDARYLDFCLTQRKLAEWDGPIVLGRWGQIQGHAYAYMCRCLAQLRLHRIQPAPSLLEPTRRAMDFMIRQDGLAITGTCGQHECWHDTQDGAANLGETCATAYLIRLLDEVLRMDGAPLYGDMMERAIHNALFAAQSPDGRRIRYYSPFEGPRSYFEGDTYCCPCNYRRIVAELPAMIYYQSDEGITLNLYTPSIARTECGGVPLTVAQETAYPSSGQVSIRLDPARSVSFALRLRIPRWCSEAKVAVNGQPLEGTIEAGAFFAIEREWQPGDRVELDMPMPLRLVKGRKAQAGRVTVMRGPLVFCLNRARNESLASEDLRLITIDPSTLAGPSPDVSVHPDGLSCTVRAWRTTNWYPKAKTDWELILTEFADPGGEAAYFHVPNPNESVFVEDELIEPATE